MNEGEEPAAGESDVPDGDEAAAPRGRGQRPSKGKGGPPAKDSWDDDWDDDDWEDDDRGGGGLDLRLVGAVVAAIVLVVLVVLFTRDDGDDDAKQGESATPNGQTEPADDKGGFCGNWPADVGGDGSNATVVDGIHVWSDFGGIHLRSNMDQPVTVKLSGNSDFSVSEPGTGAKLSAQDGKAITVDFDPGDGSIGPDFDVSCNVTVLTIEASDAEGLLETTEINIGGSSLATENPYKLVRDPA
ncbi:MAG: hypothetical protein ABI239_14500 [Aquihabitans sp.]